MLSRAIAAIPFPPKPSQPSRSIFLSKKSNNLNMLNSNLQISPSFNLPLPKERFDFSIESRNLSLNFPISRTKPSSLGTCTTLLFPKRFRVFGAQVTASRIEEGASGDLDDSPASLELSPICSETRFDRIISEARKLEQSVVVVWMAKWCRKCIYLKPKLEKLAAEYYPRIQFFCIDVNVVPHKLVARAGVMKMPTIQLWKDTEKQSEVIGGHKAYMVVNEVREMIESVCTI